MEKVAICCKFVAAPISEKTKVKLTSEEIKLVVLAIMLVLRHYKASKIVGQSVSQSVSQ